MVIFLILLALFRRLLFVLHRSILVVIVIVLIAIGILLLL
jgi:hypothetical protein